MYVWKEETASGNQSRIRLRWKKSDRTRPGVRPERSKGSYSRVPRDTSRPIRPGAGERERGGEGERERVVPSLSPYQAETNLSWRITLAVSIYSDTRRISRERPTGPTSPPLSQCTPAIHLRCMSPDVRTLAHLQNSSPRETSLNRIDMCAIRVTLVLFAFQPG